MIVYDGEFHDYASGEETQLISKTRIDIQSLLRRMRDGDSLVVNARECETPM